MRLLLKNLLFTALVPGTVAVGVPWAIAGDRSAASGLPFALGALLLALGAAIYAWTVWDFARSGRGTPAPIDAPKQLVVRGLYRYTRNPMYVGVLCVILGWSLVFVAWEIAVYGCAVLAAFDLFVRLYEEPHLARTFGDDYAAYRRRIGRWLPRRTR